MATTGEGVSAEEVFDLLAARIRTVLAPDGDVRTTMRFDEDLHADSLDLVEVIEGVERDLRLRGIVASVPDERLLALRTVGDAAAVIASLATPLPQSGAADG